MLACQSCGHATPHELEGSAGVIYGAWRKLCCEGVNAGCLCWKYQPDQTPRARAVEAFALRLDALCVCGHPLWQHEPPPVDCDEPCTALGCACEMYDCAVTLESSKERGEA